MITNLVKNNDGTYNFDKDAYHWTNVPEFILEEFKARDAYHWTNVPEFILEEFKARDAYIKEHHIDVDKWSLKV